MKKKNFEWLEKRKDKTKESKFWQHTSETMQSRKQKHLLKTKENQVLT